MKTIALIHSAGDTALNMRRAYCNALAVLNGMGIPTVSLRADQSAAINGDFSAAIAVTAQSAGGYADLRPWFNGEKSYPVLVGANYSVGEDAVPPYGYRSGMSDNTSQSSTATLMTSAVSDNFGMQYWSPHTPIADATLAARIPAHPPVEPIFTAAEGASVGKVTTWVRDWSLIDPTKSFVMWQGGDNGRLTGLLYFLNRAAIKPPRPRTVFLCLDDYTDLDAHTDFTGLDAIIALAREAGTYILCGLKGDGSAAVPARAAYTQANSDVMKCIVHNHGADYWFDDTTYPTMASKLAAHDSDADRWRAAGYTVEPGPFHGYYYCPSNAHSLLARKALATRGLKVMRGQGASSGIEEQSTKTGTIWGGPMVETLVLNDDPTDMTGDRATIQTYEPWSPVAYNYTQWSQVTALSDSAYQARIFDLTVQDILRVFQWPRHHMMFHGVNAAMDGAADCPMLTWLTLIYGPLMQLAGPDVFRYATAEDWRQMSVRAKQRS